MDRITRKSLKDDRFAAEVTHSVEYLSGHRRQATIYAGIGVAVLAVVLGIFFYRQHRQSAAHRALADALQTYRALVTQEDRPNRVVFRTQEEKDTKALKQFQDLARDFSSTQEGTIARYYVALVYNDMGNTAEAQKHLEQFTAEGNGSIHSLARLSLGDLYLTQGKFEDARKVYEYLMKNPTETVSLNRAELGMVRYLQRTNPAEARKKAMEMMQRGGNISAAAATVLRELGPQ